MTFSELIKQGYLMDSHCHLNEISYDSDRGEIVEKARKAGIKVIIDIPTDIASSKKAVQNAEKYDIVYAAVGIDPETIIPGSDLFDASTFNLGNEEYATWLESAYRELFELAKHPKVLMLGETGIDNYWLTQNLQDETIDREQQNASIHKQELLFEMHVRLAKATSKPLSIHSRNAILGCLEILRSNNMEDCVFHSLTPDIGDSEEVFYSKAQSILESKNLIGVNGIVTFKNADLIRKVYTKLLKGIRKGDIGYDLNEYLKLVYGKGFVFETDGPFLAPEPNRGERNEPAFIINIIQNF